MGTLRCRANQISTTRMHQIEPESPNDRAADMWLGMSVSGSEDGDSDGKHRIKLAPLYPPSGSRIPKKGQ
jgi:hypothetical protein